MNIIFLYDDRQYAIDCLTEKVEDYLDEGPVGVFSDNVIPISENFLWNTKGYINFIDVSRYTPDMDVDLVYIFKSTVSVLLDIPRTLEMVDRITMYPTDFSGIQARVKRAIRGKKSAKGFIWNNEEFQTRPEDLSLIAGRATKIIAKNSLGQENLNFRWRTASNKFYTFTPTEFLEFAIAVDEYIENKYEQSWA